MKLVLMFFDESGFDELVQCFTDVTDALTPCW